MLLKFGSRGNNVRILQEDLNALFPLDYPQLKLDGIFGLLTKSWVSKFQRGQNLKIDGIVGPKTLGELRRLRPFRYSPQSVVPTANSPNKKQSSPGTYNPEGFPQLNKNPSDNLTTYNASLHAKNFLRYYLSAIKPGDIIFTTEDHWLSRTIKALADLPISHCNLYTKPNYLIDSAGRVKERFIPPHFEQNNFSRVIAFQNPLLSTMQRRVIVDTARKFENAEYDNMQLLAHGIISIGTNFSGLRFLPKEPRLALKRFWVQNGLVTLDLIDTFSAKKTYSRTFGSRKKLMCSSLIVFSYMNASVNFKMTNPDLIGTDDLYSYCKKNLVKKFDVTFSKQGIVNM